MEVETEDSEDLRDFKAPVAVVGIGASAGGLESLERLFDHMTPDSGLTFIVIQHLSPDFKSLMDELLGRHSTMPIRLAESGMLVEANHVYLMPPRKEMIIEGGRLVLQDKEPKPALTRPIDLFFSSLAADAGQQAVAVVLSGSGSDGSRGILDVKRRGGLVMAESPETAKFDGMPISAIATGVVDHLCSPSEISRLLLVHSRGESTSTRPEGEREFDDPMRAILAMLREAYGIDFNLYKPGTVGRRIHRRIGLIGCRDLEAYIELLETNDDELGHLYYDLLIGVTHFFRDPRGFAMLEQLVIPELVRRKGAGEEIRVWVPGCATGEEAYSLAILLHEHLAQADRSVSLKVLATDVHRVSLERASAGLYRAEQLIHVSPARLKRYFVKRANGYQVCQELRSTVFFAPHNATRDAPFTKIDLVSCRNLLIYFNVATQKTVLSLFHFGLVPGGILFLGPSESTGTLSSEFTSIDERWKIFRKRRDVRLLDQVRLPPVPERPMERSVPTLLPRVPAAAAEGRHLIRIYDRLLDRFMPPSFLVDEESNLVDSFGGAERLLQIKGRRPSQNILHMLHGDLRSLIGGAIQKVFKQGESVEYDDVQFPTGPERWHVRVELVRSREIDPRHALVTFETAQAFARTESSLPEPSKVAMLPSSTAAPASSGVNERVTMLEDDLAFTRETLQSTIEELETSNEELQAANEELVASNEELQSTNEELHSVNEELYTVNAEHQKKIDELAELNRDMQHLLDGTDVGTLYLDTELRIRKYTARIARIFRILPQDVGRKISDFSHNIDRTSLLDELDRVHRERVRIEEEVRDADGVAYFLRILPYETTSRENYEAPAEGVVVTLTDISALERARAQLAELSAIVASSDDAIVGMNLGGWITSWNTGAERLYGYARADVVGKSGALMLDPEREHELEGILKAAARGETTDVSPFSAVRADGSKIIIAVKISPLRNRQGALVGASAIARDVSDLSVAQQAIEQREARIRLLLDSTAEAIFGLDHEGVVTFCNPACARMLSYNGPDQLVGMSGFELLTLQKKRPWPEQLRDVLERGKTMHLDGVDLVRVDGTSFPAELWARPIRTERGVVGAVVTFLDATDRRRAQEEMVIAAKRRDHFLAMLSHELRNPLAAVLNATKLIAHVGQQAPPGVRSAQGVIERQSRHMARLLEDLLDVSRITRGKFTLRKEELELGERIEVAIESLAPLQSSQNVECRYIEAGVPLPMRGDPARIQQVFANLISNGIRYSHPGSVVTIEASREGDEAVIRVRDQGVGIDPSMLPKIFELFVQAEQHLDRQDGGLGVGLTLVQHVAEAHNGRVEAYSAGVGKGSQFVLRLPLEIESKMALPSREAMESAPRRIVVVEDQDDAREMFRLLLEARGHSVAEAVDGPSGVEAIRIERPDIAFVDIGLPSMNGFEVAKAVRSERDLDGVTLVALSGYGAAADVQKARDAGFDAHVTKPADLGRVEAILRGVGERPVIATASE